MMTEQLPEGWIATSLAEIASKLVDGSHNPPAKQATGLPMLSAVNINDNKILFSDFRLITESDFKQEDQRTKIASGDILLTIVGAIGRTAVVPEGIQKFTLQRSVAVITPVLLPSKFLMYQIEAPRVAQYFKDNARGTAQKGVYLKTLGATEIWLPPLAEQHRIVAKIEELFSELDQGVASLKTAREQLKVYRQSLLKNAFEGKLTAAWRAAHRDQLETATTLQQRIARERQARYQQQLADWQTAGQSGPKPKPPKPLLPLTAEELAELPELPEGWGWGQIAGVSECLDSLRVPINKAERLKRQGEIPYYGANGQVGWIDDYLFDEPLILVVEDETFTGREKPFSYKVTGKSWVNNHAHILKPLAGIELDYLNYQLFFYPFTERTTGTTGRKKLTQEALMTSPVRVCSTLEQVEIVSQLESKLSEADQLDQTLATALQQADALRQSILKKAFCGQLVKQDQNDEPATALLERIRAEKSNGMNISRNRRKPG